MIGGSKLFGRKSARALTQGRLRLLRKTTVLIQTRQFVWCKYESDLS